MRIRAGYLCAAVAFGVVPALAHAQDSVPPSEQGGAAAVTHAVVTLEDCKRLVPHTPGADVAYQPGVDVHGNPVAKADLDSGLNDIPIPKEIVIDFGLDLAGQYGFSAAGQQVTSDIFTISYDLASEALMIDGKPLSKSDSQAVARACKMLLQPTPPAQ